MSDEWIKQENSNFWNPTQKGEEIIGEVVKAEDGKFGTSYHVKQKDGSIAITKGHKALLARMADVETGDEVKIVYLGEELPTVKGNRPTKLYDVYIRKKA